MEITQESNLRLKKFSIIEKFNIADTEKLLLEVALAGRNMSINHYMAAEIEDILKRFTVQYPNLDIQDAKFEYIEDQMKEYYILAGEIEAMVRIKINKRRK